MHGETYTEVHSLHDVVDQLLRVEIERNRLLEQAHSFAPKYNASKNSSSARDVLFEKMIQARIPRKDIATLLGMAMVTVNHKARKLHKEPGNPNYPSDHKPVPECGLVKGVKKKALEPETTSSVLTTENEENQITDEDTCRPVVVPEITIPDKCSEAMTYLESKFTEKTQWSYIHAYIQLHKL